MATALLPVYLYGKRKMEKIVLLLNAHKPDVASIDFACRIATMEKAKIVGLFIENLFEPSAKKESSSESYFTSSQQPDTVAVATDTDQSIRFFVQECARQNVQTETYLDKGEPIQETLFESRFADLLIIDPHLDFYEGTEQLPSHFVKEILAGAECPVLLSPDKFSAFDEVVFCYDGSASAVFAMKQFTYLLPSFQTKKALLLEVNKTGKEEFGEDHRRIMSWLQAHYPVVHFQALAGRAKDELLSFFFMRAGLLIVMGSYGRSQLSNFFSHSAAEGLIRTVDLPIFIAHNNL